MCTHCLGHTIFCVCVLVCVFYYSRFSGEPWWTHLFFPCSFHSTLPWAEEVFIIHTQLGLSRHIGMEPTNPNDFFVIPKKAEQTIGRWLLKCIFPLKESLIFAFVCPFVKHQKNWIISPQAIKWPFWTHELQSSSPCNTHHCPSNVKRAKKEAWHASWLSRVKFHWKKQTLGPWRVGCQFFGWQEKKQRNEEFQGLFLGVENKEI